jgi:mRNA capping enzyme, catalytic domain/mRNA capping enzyme, C-terminal domain
MAHIHCGAGNPLEACMKQFIQTAWGSPDPERFPGPQPISIERVHFPILKHEPYMVCEKTDGVRHMLVCFEFENRKYCLLVNRAFEYKYTTLAVPRGTILDGELLGDEYLVYDAVMIRGQDVKSMNLLKRLEMAKSLQIPKTPGNVKVKVKQMYSLQDIRHVNLTPHSDGLIFTPQCDPVRIGTHEKLFKWKPNNTIDFLVQQYGDTDGTPVYGLHIQGFMVKPLTRSCAMGKDPKEFDGKIVECEYGKNGWSIMKVRTDKTYPNNRRTYERTIVNIRENIQLSELKSVF